MGMTHREAAELGAILAYRSIKELSVYRISQDVLKLRRLAARAQTSAERQCNDSSYTSERANIDRDKIRLAVGRVLTADYNLQRYEVGGDPRGSTLKLYFRHPDRPDGLEVRL